MKKKINRLVKVMLRSLGLGKFLHRPRIPHGEEGIHAVGHRRYIGGMWEEIGKLQYDFLISRGLLPEHIFCDVACGSLRAGVHLIPYLNPGNYLGIDKERSLIDAGIRNEIGSETAANKKPEFVVSSSFEFESFSKKPQFGIAQSLFTHLPPSLIQTCFENLFPVMETGGEFYATFFLNKDGYKNPSEAHDHGYFAYTREEMMNFGANCGWEPEYIGEWNHPRQQVIVLYRKP